MFARHLGLSACASENLVVLELDNCPLITDTSLDHLTGCHNLQRIELWVCIIGLWLVQTDHVTWILPSDWRIELWVWCIYWQCDFNTHAMLSFARYDCQLITRQGIRRLRSHLPSIKVMQSKQNLFSVFFKPFCYYRFTLISRRSPLQTMLELREADFVDVA